MPQDEVSFEPLKVGDLPLLFDWLRDPLLVDIWFYGRIPTFKDIESKYLPRIKGEEPVLPFLIEIGRNPIGYVQSYLWRDFPEDSAYMNEEEKESASLDLFIAKAEFRKRGFGPEILQLFLKKVLFPNYQTDRCVITPQVDNTIAVRAYEKAGFRRIRIAEPPNEPSPVLLMSITREELTGETI